MDEIAFGMGFDANADHWIGRDCRQVARCRGGCGGVCGGARDGWWVGGGVAAGSFRAGRNVGPFATGWTHITSNGDWRLLFYRASDGAAVTGEMDLNGTGSLVNQRNVGPFATGWTHITPTGEAGGRL